jgi:hypothetical protein
MTDRMQERVALEQALARPAGHQEIATIADQYVRLVADANDAVKRS